MEPRLLTGPVRLALDDEVVRVAGETVDGALRAHRIGEGREPLVWAAVGRNDHGPGAVPLGENLVRVAAFACVQRVEAEIVDDEEADADESAQLRIVRVVEPRVLETLEHMIAPSPR